MSFPGEDRYREALDRAAGHEGNAAMVRVDDLKAALNEIERLRLEVQTIALTYDMAKASGALRDERLQKAESGIEGLRKLVINMRGQIAAMRAALNDASAITYPPDVNADIHRVTIAAAREDPSF